MAKSLRECALATVSEKVHPELIKAYLPLSIQEDILTHMTFYGRDITAMLHSGIRKLKILEKQCSFLDFRRSRPPISIQMACASVFSLSFFETISGQCTKITHLELSTCIVSEELLNALSCFNCLNNVILTLYPPDNRQLLWQIFSSLNASSHTLEQLALCVCEADLKKFYEELHVSSTNKWPTAICGFPSLISLQLKNIPMEAELANQYLRLFSKLRALKFELFFNNLDYQHQIGSVLENINRKCLQLKEFCLTVIQNLKKVYLTHGLDIMIPNFHIMFNIHMIENLELNFIGHSTVSIYASCSHVKWVRIRANKQMLHLDLAECHQLKYLDIPCDEKFLNFAIPPQIEVLSLFILKSWQTIGRFEFLSKLKTLPELKALEIITDLNNLVYVDLMQHKKFDHNAFLCGLTKLSEMASQHGVKLSLSFALPSTMPTPFGSLFITYHYWLEFKHLFTALQESLTENLKSAAFLFENKSNGLQTIPALLGVEQLTLYLKTGDNLCKDDFSRIAQNIPNLKYLNIVLLVKNVNEILHNFTGITKLISQNLHNRVVVHMNISFAYSPTEEINDLGPVADLASHLNSLNLHWQEFDPFETTVMKTKFQKLFSDVCSNSFCSKIDITI